MDAVNPASASAVTAPRTSRGAAGATFDALLAGLAHLAVLGSWAVTAAAVMGSLAIPRRIVMNSEWAFDTGRLPQPWVIAVGAVAIALSHAFFRWAMARFGRGVPAYGPSVVAWCGVLLGVAWGAYNWAPPVTVGQQVGPRHGESTPWGPLGWVAYYARLWLPALVALVTAVLVLFGRQSPWRAFLRVVRGLGRRRRGLRLSPAVPR